MVNPFNILHINSICSEMSDDDWLEFEERRKHWYKHYPFIPLNLSDYFDKVGLLKLYFKLEKVWGTYPAFWIAHYILKNRCEFCKYWDKNRNARLFKNSGFCYLYEEYYYSHGWCSSFKKR